MNHYTILYCLLFSKLYRLLRTSDSNRIYRLVLGLVELLCYPVYRWMEARGRLSSKSKGKPENPSVAIVCATTSNGNSVASALPTWLANSPAEIWIVTDAQVYDMNQRKLKAFQNRGVNVISCERTNKRAQLCEGFKHTKSDIIVICDDDTVWSPTVLARLTRPFQQNASIGAVFPEVKFRPAGSRFTFWETLSAIRLAGDAIDIRTSMLFDGGVFCASGTTAAYRGEILRDPRFLDRFPNETWSGRKLNAGDDQSITLWLANHNWKCHIVPDEGPSGFTVMTTPRTTWKHLHQLVRWSRSDWQACLNATLSRKAIWR